MKKVQITLEVDDDTSNERIEHELKKFLSYHFWKGNMGKIDIQEFKDK